jgi:CRP-like cAMP-binding protein
MSAARTIQQPEAAPSMAPPEKLLLSLRPFRRLGHRERSGAIFIRTRAFGGELRQIYKNKDLVVAGRPCRTFFINHNGWLFRYKILHNGDRQIVDFILPGQIFGLQACFFKASLYSIATATDASVSAIPLEAVDSVFERNLPLAKALFWSAVCEAAIVGEHLIDAARRSACERVSHLMLELFVRLKTTARRLHAPPAPAFPLSYRTSETFLSVRSRL